MIRERHWWVYPEYSNSIRDTEPLSDSQLQSDPWAFLPSEDQLRFCSQLGRDRKREREGWFWSSWTARESMSNGVYVVNEQKVSSREWLWLCVYTHTHESCDFKHYVWPPPLKAFITGKGNTTSVLWPTQGKKGKGKKHWRAQCDLWGLQAWLIKLLLLNLTFTSKHSHLPFLTSKIRYAVKRCSPSSSLFYRHYKFLLFYKNIFFFFWQKSVSNIYLQKEKNGEKAVKYWHHEYWLYFESYC